jgi:hypothetical protein
VKRTPPYIIAIFVSVAPSTREENTSTSKYIIIISENAVQQHVVRTKPSHIIIIFVSVGPATRGEHIALNSSGN